MGYLAPAAEAMIAESKAKREAYLTDSGPLFDSRLGARTIGDMALLGEGFMVWAKRDGPDQRIAYDGEARGGIVLEVTDAVTGNADGEVTKVRAFKTWNPYIGGPGDYTAYSMLTEAQVDLSACEAPDMATVRRAYRRFAKWVGEQKSTAPLDEIDVAVWCGRLAAIVGQERGI